MNLIFSLPEFEFQEVIHLLPYKRVKEAEALNLKNIIPVMIAEDYVSDDEFYETIILNVKAEEIEFLDEIVERMYKITDRINLNILDLNEYFDLDVYKEKLISISNYIYFWNQQNKRKELNVLTDSIFLEDHANCRAGDKSFVVAPNGKAFTCCGMYSEKLEKGVTELSSIGSEYSDSRLYKISNNNLCNSCIIYHCKNCIFINKIATEEFNVSPSFQCSKSMVEYEVSNILGNKIALNNERESLNTIINPMERFINETKSIRGFYKI